MLSHDGIWAGIDAFAAKHGLTASGLARKAGLDATSFNPSKRLSPDGRPRWPSTESIAKVLEATGGSLDEFIALVGHPKNSPFQDSVPLPPRIVPMINISRIRKGDLLDENGHVPDVPSLKAPLPNSDVDLSYGIEITNDDLTPLYRNGDVLIVSPTAPIKRGARVVVRTIQGDVLIREMKRRTIDSLELFALDPTEPPHIIKREDLGWIARVIWVTQ